MMARFVAFPSSTKRIPLWLNTVPDERDNWKILSGPTEHGLYIIEATESAINSLMTIYWNHYIFIPDFD